MSNKGLMERLLDSGYPRDEMFHHESDLYIYATPQTKRIVEKWCKDMGFSRSWNCPIFQDQITGRPMYDCAFQYDDYWMKIARRERRI